MRPCLDLRAKADVSIWVTLRLIGAQAGEDLRRQRRSGHWLNSRDVEEIAFSFG